MSLRARGAPGQPQRAYSRAGPIWGTREARAAAVRVAPRTHRTGQASTVPAWYTSGAALGTWFMCACVITVP